ncbi:MAG: hypothetical protein M1821_001425 [Bathelium mastoideum]|nr:MAG: hypothetical protein M1821_001425 [Bathelium mastoideum]KAI9689954.1 MAG: hypothetical protein M1822_009836 [Bathelium mastoideum]
MAGPQRPRWVLHIQAQFWRVLMAIGMILHRLAAPRPPAPSFTRRIPAKLSPRPGDITLHFYVPRDYEVHRKLGDKKFPVVVNFHGGGFTLGTATDDARWASAVVREVNAVCVSVDYRLAPEHPFPTAVEDGVDAVIHIAEHAAELGLDENRIAMSGFSSGANMAFTVPLRLQEELEAENSALEEEEEALTPAPSVSASTKAMSLGRTLVKSQKNINIAAIVAWYPPTDYTQTREQRRQTCSRMDQELPAIFTDLFDESYLQPPTMDMSNPYLSPGVAPLHMLEGLPQDIIMYTCEWDMLLAEGERMRRRLEDEVKKHVIYHMVPGVPHGWDKAPNPIKPTPGVQQHYYQACKELRRCLKSERRLSAGPRMSMSVN